MIALDHDAPVVFEPGEDGQGHVVVEEIVRVDIGDVLVRLGIGRNLKIGIDTEDLAHGDGHVRDTGVVRRCIKCHGR